MLGSPQSGDWGQYARPSPWRELSEPSGERSPSQGRTNSAGRVKRSILLSIMVLSASSDLTARLQTLRAEFPALANKRYFNFGGQGPMPQSALTAITDAHLTLQTAGPFSGSINQWIQQSAMAMRQTLADLLTVPVEAMTLTEDVTVGCNIPLWGWTGSRAIAFC